MATLGISIGIVIFLVLWRWYQEYCSLAHNVQQVRELGDSMQMAFRNALDCVAIQQYADARYHVNTAKQRWMRFRATHPTTVKIAGILADQIGIINKVIQYAEAGQYADASMNVYIAANRYTEYIALLRKTEERTSFMDDE